MDYFLCLFFCDTNKDGKLYEFDVVKLNGRLISTTRPNKTVETRTYDAAGQMLTLVDKKANGEIIQSYTFTYDAVGNLLKQEGGLLNQSLPNVLDFKDVSQEELPSSFDVNGPGLSPGTPSTDEADSADDGSQPSFDINGPGLSPTTPFEEANPTDDSLLSSDLDEQDLPVPTKKSLLDTLMTYTADNRLATYNGQAVAYDADGNMIMGPLNGEMQTYVYDSRNRLLEAGQVRYGYNSENLRTSVTVDGQTTRYVINPHAILSQVLMETDATGQAQAYYVYGLGLIGREDASGEYQTYHYDRRGSTVALTDMAGEITDTYAYGPYGEALEHTGTTAQPFQYNGRDGVMTDANGLYHMRARYYNPDIKRFINRDVLRGVLDAAQTLNRYAYVNGNPISYIDPFGLSRDGDSIWLQGGSFLLDTLPFVGSLKGFQQAFSGVNHVTGGKLSTSERWSEGIGSALSLFPVPGLKHVGKYGTDGVVSLWRKLDLQFFAGKDKGNLLDDDLAKMYKKVKQGIGSTGRTIPNTLEEQLAMKQVLSNPLKGAKDLSGYIKMSDKGRWEAKDGWIKMSNNVNGIEIHFNHNTVTGKFDDFKFK